MPRSVGNCILRVIFPLIFIGVMMAVVSLLEPVFGPKPGENPIASAIFGAVMIIFTICCVASPFIITKLSSLGESKKCPECQTKLEHNATFCPNCGIIVQHSQGQGVSPSKVLEREAQEIRRTVVRSITTHEGKLRWVKEQFFELKRPIQEIADDLGENITTIAKYIDEIEKADSTTPHF